MNNLVRHTLLIFTFTVLTCLASIFYADQTISLWINQPEFLGFRQFCRQITDAGLSEYYIGLALVMYIVGRWLLPRWQRFASNEFLINRMRRAGSLSLTSLLVAGVVLHILKISFGRQRPHRTPTFESLNFQPFNFHWHWHSFPSGHSQVLFVVATLLSLAWPRFKIGFFILAVGLSITRVVTHQHFLSDIIAGACVGYLVTLWVHHWRENRQQV